MRLVSVLWILLAISVPSHGSRAGAEGIAIRGIALGMSQAEARERVWADSPHHETRTDPATAALESDVGSTVWNLDACQPARGSSTRGACTRLQVDYSHPGLESRVMRIRLVQNLSPAMAAETLRAKLVEAHGEPASEETEYSGLVFKSPTRRTLTWAKGPSSLTATLYFYKGEEARTMALALTAEDGALIEENRAYLKTQGGSSSGPADDQLQF
jgi:hypothetical protein